MLAQNLKALEADGIVTRTVIPEVPVRTEYALSETGEYQEQVRQAQADSSVPPSSD